MKGGRSVMKWQTGCQTPHGSETLTHRLMDRANGRRGERERDGWHLDRMGGKRVGAGGFGVFPYQEPIVTAARNNGKRDDGIGLILKGPECVLDIEWCSNES